MNAPLRRYRSIGEIILEAASVLLPPARTTVSETAARYRYLSNPGSYVGPWRNETTPYLVEPMDVLASRQYREWVYVKPAQSAGTECALNLMLYMGLVNPMDMRFYEKTETAARTFARTKLDKMFRHCPPLQAELLPGKRGANAYGRWYRNGTHLQISWPTKNTLSGHSTGINFLTDYDRMPQDVDEEGSPFYLASQRGKSFGSMAMTAADSSPSFPQHDYDWRQPKDRPHLGPPCEGIVALYNEGDRRRFYWPCPDCGAYYEPSFRLLVPGPSEDIEEAASDTTMACPACGLSTPPAARDGMARQGVWLRERDKLALSGDSAFVAKARTRTKLWRTALAKPEPYSARASFWLKGPASTLTTWEEITLAFLRARQRYADTGDDASLKTTTNVDQCEVYLPPRQRAERAAEDLAERAEPLGDRVVPKGVGCLLATVDVQRGRFEVQVTGVAAGGDLLVIDRFQIRKSKRLDGEGHPWPVRPPSVDEDWDLLTEEVVQRSYPLADGSGRRMPIRLVGLDSHGEPGVTERAYAWWRRLRKQGLHSRVQLLRGTGKLGAPRVNLSFPDAQRRDRKAQARGEIPVLTLNSNLYKDALFARLDGAPTGAGAIRFADWLPIEFFQELCAETRTARGYRPIPGKRNETTDLLVYALVLMTHLKLETMDWNKPFRWAATDWKVNNTLIAPESPDADPPKRRSRRMADWARKLG